MQKENRYFEPHEIEGKIDHIQKELLKAIQVNPESRYVKRLTNSLQCWQNNYKETLKRN